MVKYGRIKKLLWVGVFLLCLCGCARRKMMSAQELEAAGIMRTEVTVEAGSRPDIKAFFDPNEAPDNATIMPELTEEQLRAAGTSYELLIYCGGKAAAVKVDIVDTTPPVISGAEDLTIYKGDTVSYKNGITLSDNADGEISLEIHNENVDLAKEGEYPVRYVAADAFGNTAEKEVMLYVVERSDLEIEVDALADALIAELVTDDMTKWDICYTLWDWCRTKIQYSYNAGDRTIYGGAYEGLRDRSGDCYVYYATFTVLLRKCGIETMEVRRVGGTSDHWWNLVNLGDGWYHCDSSPRRTGDTYECFMQTDAQLQAYTDSYPEHPNYYVFDASLLPERETKIVYGA